MSKLKKRKRYRFLIKLLLCSIYSVIIFVLCFSSFKIYEKENTTVEWKDVEKTNQYSYLEISEMSEAFAEIPNEGKQIHFVIEKEETGEWHTYLLAIKKTDYDKYKNIIDYTYERVEQKPEKIRVYGYPVKIPDNIKELAIKNIGNFVPIENEIVLNNDNFEQYLTNTYLDASVAKVHEFNYFVMTLLFVALALFILLLFTIFDKDRLVDEVDHIIEDEKKKPTTKRSASKENKTLKKDKKVKNNNDKEVKTTNKESKESTQTDKKNTKKNNKKNIKNSAKKVVKKDDDIEII